MARTLPGDSSNLGLGGASLIHRLASLPFSITAVEISSEIIEIAKNYFMIDKLSNLELAHMPAEDYLEQYNKKFSNIMIDLYDAQAFPAKCNNSRFFFNCKKNLKPDGFLSVNLANSKEQYAILQLIKKYFINTLVIPITKCANIVIIASNHTNRDDFLNAVQKNKEINKLSLVTCWGYLAEL